MLLFRKDSKSKEERRWFWSVWWSIWYRYYTQRVGAEWKVLPKTKISDLSRENVWRRLLVIVPSFALFFSDKTDVKSTIREPNARSREALSFSHKKILVHIARRVLFVVKECVLWPLLLALASSRAQGEMIKFHREKIISLVPFRTKRARARNSNNKRKNAEKRVYTTRSGAHESYLVCKSDFAPERCRCQRRGCHRRRRCYCVKSEENEARDFFKCFFACISSPKRFFFRGPETQEKRGKRRSFFSLFIRKRMSPNPKKEEEEQTHFFCIFFTRICK